VNSFTWVRLEFAISTEGNGRSAFWLKKKSLPEKHDFRLGRIRHYAESAPRGGEAVLWFPAGMLPAIVGHLAFLRQKAIPVSRAKGVFLELERRRSAG